MTVLNFGEIQNIVNEAKENSARAIDAISIFQDFRILRAA